jgi:hypothetical protein
MQLRQWRRFLWKKCHPPPPCRFAWKFRGKLNKFTVILSSWLYMLLRNFREFWNYKYYDASRQNLFANFVDLTRLACLPWLILQPSVASTMIFYESSHEPLALSMEHIRREKFSWTRVKKKIKHPPHTFTWLPSPLIIMIETQATTHCCLKPFRWESPW